MNKVCQIMGIATATLSGVGLGVGTGHPAIGLGVFFGLLTIGVFLDGVSKK